MKRIALILLAATALLVAGCGSNSEQNDYVKQVNAADANATAALSSLSAGGPKTPKAASDAFNNAANRLALVVKDYEAIDPPDNAKTAHATNIAGVKGLVVLFRRIADQYRTAKTPADFAKLQKSVADFPSAKPFQQLSEARQELAKAGYKVDAPGTPN